MLISDIKDKELRELAELRRRQKGWTWDVEHLETAFVWDATTERAEFWLGVCEGVITSLRDQSKSIETVISYDKATGELRIVKTI